MDRADGGDCINRRSLVFLFRSIMQNSVQPIKINRKTTSFNLLSIRGTAGVCFLSSISNIRSF